jgi:hypothetical protein
LTPTLDTSRPAYFVQESMLEGPSIQPLTVVFDLVNEWPTESSSYFRQVYFNALESLVLTDEDGLVMNEHDSRLDSSSLVGVRVLCQSSQHSLEEEI